MNLWTLYFALYKLIKAHFTHVSEGLIPDQFNKVNIGCGITPASIGLLYYLRKPLPTHRYHSKRSYRGFIAWLLLEAITVHHMITSTTQNEWIEKGKPPGIYICSFDE